MAFRFDGSDENYDNDNDVDGDIESKKGGRWRIAIGFLSLSWVRVTTLPSIYYYLDP